MSHDDVIEQALRDLHGGGDFSSPKRATPSEVDLITRLASAEEQVRRWSCRQMHPA